MKNLLTKKRKTWIAAALACALSISSLTGYQMVSAAEVKTQEEEMAKVNQVHQTNASYNSVSLSWDAFNVTGKQSEIQDSTDGSSEKIPEPEVSYFYEVHLSEIAASTVNGSDDTTEEAKEWTLKATTYDNHITLYDLEPGKDYFVRVIAKTKTIPRKTVTNYYDKVKVSTIPAKANIPEITDLSTNHIALSWDTVAGANKYEVIGYKDGDTEKSITGNTKDTHFVLSKLAAGTTYRLVVYAVNDNGTYAAVNNNENNAITVTTLPDKIEKISLKDDYNGRKAQVISWQPTNVEGYEVTVKSSGSSVVKTYDVATNICDITKFTANSWQNARVRGYITVGGIKKYSGFSDPVYFAKQTNASKVRQLQKKKTWKAQAKVTWKKVKGSSSYSLYLSKKPISKYVKIGTTKKKSFILKSYKGVKLKAKKTYYVRILANKKVGKKKYTSFVANKYKKFRLKK